MRVLVVEDVAKLAELLQRRLRREGMGVDVARDIDEALARAAATDYDLILLDVMLPDRDGFELCRVLRASGIWCGDPDADRPRQRRGSGSRPRRRDLEAEMERFREVHNAAWESNWGFVPLPEREIARHAGELKPLLEEGFTWVAEKDGETVGVALTLLDYNRVLAAIGNGRLLPLGWLRALRARRNLDEIRVFALGVKPEYQHTGVAAAFYREHWERCIAEDIVRAETGWILETNEPMNRAMQALGGDVIKRYRIYNRALAA